MSTVISESTRTVLECALHCDYSGKKTNKFSKYRYKYLKDLLVLPVTRPKLPLCHIVSGTLTHATYDVFSQKAV